MSAYPSESYGPQQFDGPMQPRSGDDCAHGSHGCFCQKNPPTLARNNTERGTGGYGGGYNAGPMNYGGGYTSGYAGGYDAGYGGAPAGDCVEVE